MKKNLIYTVTFLLCGAFFFSSCEDMLNVDSNRVEYEFDDWTFNDSVYSVLGILKSVQKVGDRHILLNELRGDLLATNNKTLDDVLEISNYEFDTENNQYLDVKDYFTIINNCNLFLARVDTTLEYDNRRIMLREYVAVKSIRAWTYMQLIKNHEYIPFFTEPVLTHSKAEEIMASASADHLTIINKLIEDIEKYENPALYKMPLWEIPDFVDKAMTHKLFPPIRILLGDLYLWRASIAAQSATYPLMSPNPDSDFAKAAKCYYTYLTEDNARGDATHTASHANEKPDEKETAPRTNFLSRFVQEGLNTNSANMVSVIHYANNANTGQISKLADVFAPIGDAGLNQVVASPSLVGLSARQVYNYREEKTSTTFVDYIVKSEKWPGDLRLYSTVASQRGTDLNKTLYKNMILKFNVDKTSSVLSIDESLFYTPKVVVNNIILDRPEHVYLRFAEALMGLEREGWTGAKELAMTVLKTGVKKEYKLYWQPDTIPTQLLDEYDRPLTTDLRDENGKVVKLKVPVLDEEGQPVVNAETNIPDSIDVVQKAPVVALEIESDFEPLVYDFLGGTFSGNKGIHSRGSGFTESNPYYALTDSCIAQYFNITPNGKVTIVDYEYNDDGSVKMIPVYEDEEKTKYLLDADGNVVVDTCFTEPLEIDAYDVNDDLRVEYMYDKIIDEMALEMAWEGHRFGNLVRIATALGNNDFFALRVAARNVSDVDWREAKTDPNFLSALYEKLSSSKSNWYIPLPEECIVPTTVPETPSTPIEPEVPESGEGENEGENDGENDGEIENTPTTPDEDDDVAPVEPETNEGE